MPPARGWAHQWRRLILVLPNLAPPRSYPPSSSSCSFLPVVPVRFLLRASSSLPFLGFLAQHPRNAIFDFRFSVFHSSAASLSCLRVLTIHLALLASLWPAIHFLLLAPAAADLTRGRPASWSATESEPTNSNPLLWLEKGKYLPFSGSFGTQQIFVSGDSSRRKKAGGSMVAEPLVHKVLSMATSSSKKARLPAASAKVGEDGSRVGILSFEVANAMSRAANLYRSLSDAESARLLGPLCLGSHAVRALVAGDDALLLALALAEKLDALNRVAAVATRLGRRCTVPALVGFDHVYADLLAGRSDAAAFASPSESAASLVRKLDRLAAATAALYAELETLTELEQSARKLPTDEARRALEQRTRWRRHDARRLRDSSLWNWTYDKAVLLLARAVCAIYHRIRLVFGDPMLGLDLLASTCDQSRQLSGPMTGPISGPVKSNLNNDSSKSGPICRADHTDMPRSVNFRSSCGASPGKMFMECLSLSSSVSWKDGFEDEFLEDSSCISTIRSGMLVQFSGEQGLSATPTKSGRIDRRVPFGPKSTVTSLAPPSTIGGSALALHYANVVIIIEKLLRYPHLVGEEARDDLYQMLPSSLKVALRKNLKTYVKNMAIYDAFLAHDWRETLEKTLAWLGPMAHNMIRWQAERNFEQQQIVLKGNVFLLQTLYFADRQKTEAVICELLVGLNYICRYEQQQNALLDCSSSLDFDDCVEWQLE